MGQGASQPQPASETGRRHRPDYAILVLTALLLVIGLIVVYSISPGLSASQHVSQSYFITKQLLDVALGAAAFAIAAVLPLRRWSAFSRSLIVATVVGSVIVMITPINAIYPAHRWIRIGGFSFQVAELIKLTLIVGLANFLSGQWRKGKLADFKATLKPLIIVLLGVGIVVAKLQSDLGSAGVMIVIMAAMAFTVGIPLKKVALICALVTLVFALAIASSGYRRQRLATFLHPSSDCRSSGYHACQALIAVGSGGVFGEGLGFGAASYGYLPESSNDSIFAIMAQKFGFIGTTLIVTIYGFFITRIKKLIERTNDQFSRLILVGVLAWLSTQTIVNIGAMLGLLPLKGITLPLISQGGTSLIFLTAALGIVFQISRYTSYNVTEPKTGSEQGSNTNSSSNRRRLRRPYNPPTISRPRT
ncbi:hypothetical protein BVY00_00460 [bacterium G20]|nr:hypothetical protein BVY00_00460 [bacterium G20]